MGYYGMRMETYGFISKKDSVKMLKTCQHRRFMSEKWMGVGSMKSLGVTVLLFGTLAGRMSGERWGHRSKAGSEQWGL